MPEVVRGSRPALSLPTSPADREGAAVSPFGDASTPSPLSRQSSPTTKIPPPPPPPHPHPLSRQHVSHDGCTPVSARVEPPPRRSVQFTRQSLERPPLLSDAKIRGSSSWRRERRDSMRQAEADVYYDSRAATIQEFRRRATTLQDYYTENPKLLPQLPFTWHHGWRRFRLGMLILLMFVDACVLPIILYYGLDAGDVAGWIIFAIVTTIWGGPTYLEFAVRSWRLVKKERFYRPLGTNSRWCFDLTTWASILAITSVTTLFVVGSAPHIVWLRVLCMPGPALLYSIGGVLFLLTLFNICGWKAPFRISSTGKGELVRPGIYYFVEDVVAVNAGAGRPFREALAARYEASPRFRRIMYVQSIFWSVPAIILAIPLTVIAVIHPVPSKIAYGVCWGVPFVWVMVWAVIAVPWIKRDLRREREEWEADDGVAISDQKEESEP